MTNTYKTVHSAAPLWAAFGAPLVGAPILMVTLLAFAPSTGTDGAAEPEVGYAVEQVEASEVDALVPIVLEAGR